MKKVVLLGGTFDPIHNGHIAILEDAIKLGQFDEGWLVLASQSPLKDADQLSFEIRAQFINWAIENHPKLRLCTIEESLPQPNYTINTIKKLKEIYPNIEFFYLIGSDQAQQFTKWKDYQQLLGLITILVYPRDGYETYDKSLFTEIKAHEIPISSTEIRQMVSFDTHKRILDEIFLKGYYVYERLTFHLKDKRMKHSLGVAVTAKKIAKWSNADKLLSYSLGVHHDLYKEKEPDFLRQFLTIDEQQLPVSLWHGFALYHHLSKVLSEELELYLKAIYHHTTGDDQSLYSKILYIADKTEPNRKTKKLNKELLKLTKEDLDKGFIQVRKEAQAYYERKKNDNSK